MKQLPEFLRHTLLLGRQKIGLLMSHRLTRRLLLAVTGIFLLVLAAIAVLLWRTYQAPAPLIVNLLGRAGFEAELRDAKISGAERLELYDLRVGDFLVIDYLETQWSYRDLARGRLDRVRIQNGRLSLAKLQAALGKNPRDPGNSPKKSGMALELNRLVLNNVSLVLDNLGEGVPPIPLRLGELTPLTIEHLRLGGSSTDPSALEERVAKVEGLVLWSPHDPLAQVLSFKTIEIAFSWQGIVNNQLNRVSIDQPRIFIGEDLFWFVDQIKKQGTVVASVEEDVVKAVPVAPSRPWSIQRFELGNGELVLTSFGQPGLTLPVKFGTATDGLVLADFANLPLKVQLSIKENPKRYPEYGLNVGKMEGEIYFNLPLGSKNTNITPYVNVEYLEWKGVRTENIGVELFFDKNQISAKAQAQAYQGSANSWLNVDIQNGFAWTGGAYASTIELEPITRLLSPDNLLMDGPVSATLEAGGQSKFVQALKGTVKLDRPGTMEITAIDDVLKKLPPDWSALKKQLSEMAMGSMRTYNYTVGTCDFAYIPERSYLRLHLDGLQGRRNLDIQWLDQRENPGFGY
jgi:hypothetical protein